MPARELVPIVSGCPGDLDATGKARWRRAHAFIEEQWGWEDVYASTLERYVRAWAYLDQARALLAAEGLTVPGSKGQPAQHPALKTYVEAARLMESAAFALGLTPAARTKLGEPKPPAGPGKFGGACKRFANQSAITARHDGLCTIAHKGVIPANTGENVIARYRASWPRQGS